MLADLPEQCYRTAASRNGSVLLRTARPDSANLTSYLFTDPLDILVVEKPDEIPTLFRRIEEELSRGHYLAGYLSYECGHHFEARTAENVHQENGASPLAWFGVYADSEICKDAPEGRELKITRPSPFNGQTFLLAITEDDYRSRVERIKRYIEAGDTYQVNFTTELNIPYAAAPVEIFRALMESQPVAYGAFLNLGSVQIVSASPELFFRVKGGQITTQPMKGTAPRGKDIEEDAALSAWLRQDEKNRSENVMIVDLVRNDLGRVCVMGSVSVEELFAVERYRTLFQMTSTISGQLLPGTGYYEIFRALFPCGSVVGAPKVRTMQIIHELEQRSRGVYTGAIGFISPSGEAVFSVVIRTLVLRDGMAKMGVGSGIVYDSHAKAEYDECRLKASFIKRSAPEFQLLETMLWDGEYFLLQLHLERIAASASYFDFPFELERAVDMLGALARSFEPRTQTKVRLSLDQTGRVHLESAAMGGFSSGVSLVVSAERVSSDDVFLRHKTTNRTLYDRLYSEALRSGFDDVLFLNERDEVTETAIHNIFVERNGVLMTPPTHSGALPGVYRKHWLKMQPKTRETILKLDDLLYSERVFVCNSVRGVRPVKRVCAADGTELKTWETAPAYTGT